MFVFEKRAERQVLLASIRDGYLMTAVHFLQYQNET